MAYKGRFRPANPKKYAGNPTNIIYRSSWEMKMMLYFDKHPDILEWSSEEIVIPYLSPLDNKIHRYFPDFYVKKKGIDGKIKILIIEIKPHGQTKEPNVEKKNATKTGRVSRRYLNEVKNYAINTSKWKAAQDFCTNRGWEFTIITEKDIKFY